LAGLLTKLALFHKVTFIMDKIYGGSTVKDEKLVESKGIGKEWQDKYQKKIVTAEEAVKLVRSGDRVIASYLQARLLTEALAARKDELRDVTIHSNTPTEQIQGVFFQEGMDDVFYNTIEIYIGDWARTAPIGTDTKRSLFWPGTFSSMMKPFDERFLPWSARPIRTVSAASGQLCGTREAIVKEPGTLLLR